MSIEQSYDFKRIENEVSELWKQHDSLIKKTLKHDPKRKLFSWLEGPPTANAPPALHHVEVRVFKDVMCRFKYLQGYSVPRKGGWDCHGLPVEVQVEKKLGLKSKKDVLAYGIGKFNQQCREDVFKFITDWNAMTERLAFLVDLENPYRTLDNEYIESVWWSLKELFKKALLYEGHKVVPYCPRCETALSSHEVALGYKDVTDPAITIKFALKDHPHRKFLAWTTTPWTLPSNFGLAVNPHMTYAVIKKGDEEFVLAKELVKKIFGDAKIVSEIKGADLVGRSYVPLFNYFEKKLTNAWKILPGEFVSAEEGTGIVHLAPFGEDDFEVFKQHSTEYIITVNTDGTFTDDVHDFKGLFVKHADKKIIEHLDAHGLLFKKEQVQHSYPFCWRCSSPLLYYPLETWFVAVSKFREKLVARNETIAWYPDHIKEGRFGNWLVGAKDWALSRKRYWATPMPVWKCSCGHVECIGSIAELKKLAKGRVAWKQLDLHMPFVDELKLTCPSCKKVMARVSDVIDCWYDSGAAPFAQFHYPFENKDLFAKSFPYDFIAEAIDQTRGWFYTLHVLGNLLFDSVAFKRCAVGGLLCDEKGEKMSKSKGNIIVPAEIFDKVGVDAVRLLMCYYPLGEQIRFGMAQFNEVVLPFLRILWNSFYYTHEFFDMQSVSGLKKPSKLEKEDEWLLSKVNSLVAEVTDSLDAGKYSKAVVALQEFVNDDLSRCYIKIVRNRTSQPDKALAFVLRYTFDRLIILLAPFAPYTSEALYQRHGGKKKSVHVETWPKIEERNIELEAQMAVVRDLIASGLAMRDKVKVGVRWPLQALMLSPKDDTVEKAVKTFEAVVKEQLNVKEIRFGKISGERFSQGDIALELTITAELEAEGFARELIRRIQDLRKRAGMQKQDKITCSIQSLVNLSAWNEAIAEKVGASTLTISSELPEKLAHHDEFAIRDKKFVIELKKE